MLRAGTGENVILHRRGRQRRIVHMLQLIAGYRLAAISNSQHLTDAHGRLRVVTGDHLHTDPRLLTGVDGIDRFRARWIHHAGDPQHDQPAAEILMT